MNKKRIIKKGYLKVTDGHKLYYEVYGNPKGIPVLYLHGGPGAGFSDKDKLYFNPKVYKVILFDQRGSGRSKPFASLKGNTTHRLVEDINQLLKLTGINKVFLFGGSWGSTLALIYAVKNPQKISGMLVRGIYLATYREKKYFEMGGVKPFFPDVWKRFISLVPQKYRKNPSAYYLRQMKSKDKKKSDKYAFEWFYYEASLCKIGIKHEEIMAYKKTFNYKALSPIECSYLSKDCYIPENYILKNIGKLKNLPVSIVQGRFDMICPPESAFKLHAKLPKSKLHILPAGHISHEKSIHRKLTGEMKKFEKILSR